MNMSPSPAPSSALTSPASSMLRWMPSHAGSALPSLACPRRQTSWTSNFVSKCRNGCEAKTRRRLFWREKHFHFAVANTVFPVRGQCGGTVSRHPNSSGGRNSMDMKKRDFLGLAAGVGAVAGFVEATGQAEAQPRRANLKGPIDVNQRSMVSQNVQPSTVDWNYKPRRVNKAIELWEDGQPIYYNGSGLG